MRMSYFLRTRSSPRAGGADILVCLFCLLSLLLLPAQAQVPNELLTRAEKLARERPSAERSLGLLEMRRGEDVKPAPFRAADLPKAGPLRDATLEAIAWRM